MSILHEAYTALLSGITTKTGNEIRWTDGYGQDMTIEPIDISQENENGKKWWKEEYQKKMVEKRISKRIIAWKR